MGVDLYVLDFLMKFKGRLRGEALQLGKQGFHISKTDGFARSAAESVIFQYDPDAKFDDIAGVDGFTEILFKYLGVDNVFSMDASAYEGADYIYDLNCPISKEYENRFDVIFDGGTIEHIYNVPIAFENVKRMLKIGGVFLSVNAANNQLGHGFYQFSPELMWRVFSDHAGFKVDLMQLVVLEGKPSPIDTPDPAVTGRRMQIGTTTGATYILAAVTKHANSSREVWRMQSDYMSKWETLKHVNPGDAVPDTHG